MRRSVHSSIAQAHAICSDRTPIGVMPLAQLLPLLHGERDDVIRHPASKNLIGQSISTSLIPADSKHVYIRKRIPISSRQGAKQPEAAPIKRG